MVDLGIKQDNKGFDAPGSDAAFPKVTYPTVSLPLSIMEKKAVKLHEEIEIVLKGEITEIVDNDYLHEVCIKLSQGEIKGKDKEEAAEGAEDVTLLTTPYNLG